MAQAGRLHPRLHPMDRLSQRGRRGVGGTGRERGDRPRRRHALDPELGHPGKRPGAGSPHTTSSPARTVTPASSRGPSGSTRATRRRRASSRQTATLSTERRWRWRSSSRTGRPRIWATSTGTRRPASTSWGESTIWRTDTTPRACRPRLRRRPATSKSASTALALEGEVACVLGTLDVEDDAGIIFVATPPAMRGRRLASRLLTAALIDARERGMRTSSLQASALGSPIYERLGYRTYFRFHILERQFETQG